MKQRFVDRSVCFHTNSKHWDGPGSFNVRFFGDVDECCSVMCLGSPGRLGAVFRGVPLEAFRPSAPERIFVNTGVRHTG